MLSLVFYHLTWAGLRMLKKSDAVSYFESLPFPQPLSLKLATGCGGARPTLHESAATLTHLGSVLGFWWRDT